MKEHPIYCLAETIILNFLNDGFKLIKKTNMKTGKLFSIFFVTAIICSTANSQTPNKFNFQGLARNSEGIAVANKIITIRFTIHDSSGTGKVLYKETQKATTDESGLFAVVIGGIGATGITGNLKNINWSFYDKFLQTEMKLSGETKFVNLGTTQLLSVPYAEQARKADTAKFTAYTSSLKTVVTDASDLNGNTVTGGLTSVVSFTSNNYSDTSFNSSTHEYTVPSSGNYLIAFNIELIQLSSGKANGLLAIRINGSNTLYTQQFWYPANSDAVPHYYPLTGTYIRYFSVGQKITIAVLNNGSGSDQLSTFRIFGTSLNIFKIGNR